MAEAPLDRVVRVVADHEDALRADVVLAAWLDEPRAKAQERLAAGQVAVGSRLVAKSRRLRAGERVVVTPPPPAAPRGTPPHVPVRYRDDHVAVVAKPAGLVVHEGAGALGPTMVDALLAAGLPLQPGEDPLRPGIVHRLDRGTSGLLVVALSAAAMRALQAAFKVHAVERGYWALVEGTPHPLRATIDAPIGRSTTRRTRFTVAAAGRRAVSHYDVEQQLGPASLVQVRLETGRTHQVRVHLSAVGHPVAGDVAYGASAPLAERLGLVRPALHARRLAFDHPVSGERIDLDEPPPHDLMDALAALRQAAGVE